MTETVSRLPNLTRHLLDQPHDLLCAAGEAQSKIMELRHELNNPTGLVFELEQHYAILQYSLNPVPEDKVRLEAIYGAVFNDTRSHSTIRHHMRAICRRIDDLEHWISTFQRVIRTWQVSRGLSPSPTHTPLRENEPQLYAAAQETNVLY